MSLSGPGPTCSFFWGSGIPAFIATFLIAQFAMASVTNNKALLLMIPQFLGQAAMLIPIALLFRWKYERPFLGSLRLGVRVPEIWPSFGAGIFVAVSVLLIAAALRIPECLHQ